MVAIRELSIGISTLSGILGLLLLVVAVRAYRQSRTPALAFVAGAFTMFCLKSFLVAYSVSAAAIEHETLEFIDAAGDLGTILLLTLPLLWPPR